MKFHVGAPKILTKTYKGQPAGLRRADSATRAFVIEKRCPVPNNSTAHQLICGKIPLEIKDFSSPSRKSNACEDNLYEAIFSER
jgi:hypothetical protein